MNTVKHYLELDLKFESTGESCCYSSGLKEHPGKNTVVISRGDNLSHELIISLKHGRKPYIITDDCYAYLYAMEEGGKSFLAECTVESNEIHVTVTANMLTHKNTAIEVSLVNEHGAILSTPLIHLVSINCDFYREAGEELDTNENFSAMLEALVKAEASQIVSVKIIDGDLIITYANGNTVNAGRAEGAPGAPVTIKSIKESSEYGGDNVVTFSDGSVMTVKNGVAGDAVSLEAGVDLGFEPIAYNVLDFDYFVIKTNSITYVLNHIMRSSGEALHAYGYFFDHHDEQYILAVHFTKDENGYYTATVKHEFADGTELNPEDYYISYTALYGFKYSSGLHGRDGVGIESIEQITTSAEDGGVNVVEVTLTDGQTATFDIRNGYKGDKGDKGDPGEAGAPGTAGKDGADGVNGKDGADGKSAYEYAKDAGYTGTEEEFAHKLASSDNETELVLSDNLLDKSLLTKGQVFYYGGSGYELANSLYSHYGFIPLRGVGTYRTKFQAQVHSYTGTNIALVNDDNVWVANASGTVGEVVEDENWVDFEFVVTHDMIAKGATKIAYDVYELFMDETMIVKNRTYPDEYIPYGYIEVSTDKGKKLDNVLCEKTSIFLGDSICAGTTVPADSGFYNYGWGGIIGEANRMNWTNYGKNGGTITHRGSDATCIANIADTAISEHPAADYVIFEGGCNDADQMKDDGLGVISADYETFDTSTFSGAFEALILKLVTAFPNAKIGYIIPQKMYTGYADYTASTHIHRKYFDRALAICKKWGIPVIDIWNNNPLNPKLSTSSIYYVEENGQHLTLAGYQRITPQIEAWMRGL